MNDVVIIGAGLSGLIAARRLAAAGLTVEVIEKRETVGGRVRTRTIDGFTVDRGFQVLFTSYPAARAALDYDGLSLQTFTPGAIIARPGQRSTLSDPRRDPGGAIASMRQSVGSPVDLIRAIKLWRHLRSLSVDEIFPGSDQSIAAYLHEWGFSQSLVDDFFRPFYGGITLDRSLSSAASVFEYTTKMLLDGDIAVPATGMGAIPSQLADAARDAGAAITTGTHVQSVESMETTATDGVTIRTKNETMESTAAIVATDPRTARTLTDVTSIPTAGRGCVTHYFSIPGAVDLETGGRLLLNGTTSGPNHIAPMSSVAPEYAPPDQQLFAATYLGDAPDDGTVKSLTQRTLQSWYPDCDFESLTTIHIDRIEFAQFAQSPGMHAALPGPGTPDGQIYLAGEYTRWSSIQGALESGHLAAETVLNGLETEPYG